MALGYAGWIDEQLALPAQRRTAPTGKRRERGDQGAPTPSAGAGQDEVLQSFWKQALTGDDQLRQRVAFALSQIFVISMVDGNVGNNPRAVAAWLDMLGDNGLGNYRELLESVSRCTR